MIALSAVQSSTQTLFTLLAMITHFVVQSSTPTLFVMLSFFIDTSTMIDTIKVIRKPYLAIIASNGKANIECSV